MCLRNQSTKSACMETCSITPSLGSINLYSVCFRHLFCSERNGRAHHTHDEHSSILWYLSAHSKKSRLQHRSPKPIRNFADSLCEIYQRMYMRQSSSLLWWTLEEKHPYKFVFLNSFTPDASHKRQEFLQSLERSGCNVSTVIMTHFSGNNAGNIQFTWRVSPTELVDVTLNQSQRGHWRNRA